MLLFNFYKLNCEFSKSIPSHWNSCAMEAMLQSVKNIWMTCSFKLPVHSFRDHSLSKKLCCTLRYRYGSSNYRNLSSHNGSESDSDGSESDGSDAAQSLYPKTTNIRRSQASKSYRPPTDPAKTSILLFPGQGSQFAGMAKELTQYPNVEEMFKVASECLGYDLLELCVQGPRSELDKTVHCQPAVFVTSLAAVEKLRYENPQAIENCIAAAGFSVGEYTALVFAGAISFEDAIHIVKMRAEAMQEASELISGAMASVFLNSQSKLKLACEIAKEYCRKHNVENPECLIANYLYPECKVIAGNDEAIKFIEVNKHEFNLLRVKRLPVSGAFHSSLMKPAVEPLRSALSKVTVKTPLIPVHSNVDGKQYKSPEHIRQRLEKQVYRPIKWEQTMHVLYERTQGVAFPKTYEVGPGKQLTAILKVVNQKAFDSCTTVI